MALARSGEEVPQNWRSSQVSLVRSGDQLCLHPILVLNVMVTLVNNRPFDEKRPDRFQLVFRDESEENNIVRIHYEVIFVLWVLPWFLSA